MNSEWESKTKFVQNALCLCRKSSTNIKYRLNLYIILKTFINNLFLKSLNIKANEGNKNFGSFISKLNFAVKEKSSLTFTWPF